MESSHNDNSRLQGQVLQELYYNENLPDWFREVLRMSHENEARRMDHDMTWEQIEHILEFYQKITVVDKAAHDLIQRVKSRSLSIEKRVDDNGLFSEV